MLSCSEFWDQTALGCGGSSFFDSFGGGLHPSTPSFARATRSHPLLSPGFSRCPCLCLNDKRTFLSVLGFTTFLLQDHLSFPWQDLVAEDVHPHGGGGVLDELLSATVIKRHDQGWLVEERVHFWLLAPAGSKSIMVGKARQQDLEQEAEGSHLQPRAESTESKPEVWQGYHNLKAHPQ